MILVGVVSGVYIYKFFLEKYFGKWDLKNEENVGDVFDVSFVIILLLKKKDISGLFFIWIKGKDDEV